MKILICDDDSNCLKFLQNHIQEYMDNHYIVCDIYATIDGSKVLNNQELYDIAFLDIRMDKIDGISLAKVLKNRNIKLILFFVTNYNEYMDDAMNLFAFRFFQKPFDVTRLYAALDKAMEYINIMYIDIYIYRKNVMDRILIDDILYITRHNRRTYVVTKKESIEVKNDFDDLCSQLPSLFFYLVHKSYYINLHHVYKYSYTELYMGDNRVPIATRKQANFHKYWYKYLRGF